MNVAATLGQARARALAYWMARTEQERRTLSIGAGVLLLALAYLVLIAPAWEGRAELRRTLPQLRQQAAQLLALADEARSLAAQPAPQVAPMTREALLASLTARGINPASLTLTGEYAKAQLNNVSFANLMAWLDAQRRESRVQLQDGAITALPVAGQVDATLTLRQATAGAAAQ
ncbi:type II secretion system protein GspM [Massilia solisilvae]